MGRFMQLNVQEIPLELCSITSSSSSNCLQLQQDVSLQELVNVPPQWRSALAPAVGSTQSWSWIGSCRPEPGGLRTAAGHFQTFPHPGKRLPGEGRGAGAESGHRVEPLSTAAGFLTLPVSITGPLHQHLSPETPEVTVPPRRG